MGEKTLKLRQNEELVNNVKVVGYLKAKTVEEGTTDGKSFIRGSLSVLTNDTQVTVVDFYFGKETKDGNISKLYENAKKLNDYTSIVDLVESKRASNEEEAKQLCDIVQINGNINPNEYLDEENKLVSRPKINGKFFHRLDKTKKIDYSSFGTFFDAVIFFKSIKAETKNNIETGRAVVEAIIPTSINPAIVGTMTFYVTTENGAADYIINNYEKNRTGHIYGEFKVNRVEEKTSGFGAKNKAASESISYEWIITGGDTRQYDEESKNAYDIDALKEALAQRLQYAEEQKAKRKTKSDSKSGFSSKSNNNISKNQEERIKSQFDDNDF